MAKPARKPARVESPSALPDPPAPDVSALPSDRPAARRLSVIVGPDGRIELDRLHTTTRDALKTALGDPALLRGLGLTPDVGTGPAYVIPPSVSMALVSAFNTIEIGIVAKVTKGPRHLVEPIAQFSQAEAAALAGPLTAVLNKYGSTVLQKYGDEIGLLVVFSSLTMAKISAVKDAMGKSGPSRVVPISEPPTSDSESVN